MRKYFLKAGERFGFLTVVNDVIINGNIFIKCQCDCGNEAIVLQSHLIHNQTKSCGCWRRRGGVLNPGWKHGKVKHPLYPLWRRIIDRCYCKQSNRYPDYGGRGIGVYKDWRKSPILFIEYIEKLPKSDKADLTIDRIDNNKDYEPGNLRWADKTIQSVNKRISKTNTSGYCGVCRSNKKNKQWYANIRLYGKNIFLGLYYTPEQAVIARNKYIINNDLEKFGIHVQSI
jgi:hypothetical protein